MDAYDVAKHLIIFGEKLIRRYVLVHYNPDWTKKLIKVLGLIAPALVIICVYQYLKFNMIQNSYRYERSITKKRRFLKKVSYKLKQLSTENGQVYFCYMPIHHGTKLPHTYSLFMAIKEVLIDTDIPVTRGMRTNLLSDLIHSDVIAHADDVNRMDLQESDLLYQAPNDAYPLSEVNFDIMNCSREMIIYGIKDFDIMYTLHHLMETVSEDIDEYSVR